ncbi:pyridoxal phosphate-dependent aminotransferase [Arcanobacterium hippocoleae]
MSNIYKTPQSRASVRLGALQESATLAVDAKAKALKAAGKPVIGFAAGEPDFPTPAPIVAAALAAVQDPKNHKYTPAVGLPELRKVIAEKTLRDSGVEVDPANIIVTNGGKQAVFQAFAAIVSDGDDVILPAPYWTTYPEVIRLCGGNPIEVFAGADQEYKVTVEQLNAALTAKTKALLLCSPSNPTGAVYTAAEIKAIGKWALENGIWVISDEIYEHLVYDGEVSYLLREVPELANQTIIVNGVAKTYAMTGWRVGWMYGPADVIKKAANFQSHLTSNVANISQRAALAALSGDQGVVEEMKQAFNRRRKKMVEMLREIDGFEVPEPKGAFYVFPNVEQLLGTEINGRTANTSSELAVLILEEAEVAVVPGEAFGAPGYLRFSYPLSDDALEEGITRLQKLFA